MDKMLARISRLNEIGIALSAEQNVDVVCDNILKGAMELTRADGGSLYSMAEDGRALNFTIVATRSLGIYMGGVSGKDIDFPAIQLYQDDGSKNMSMVVSSAVHDDHTINIPDTYHALGFDFSGTRKFDEKTGYHTKSVLTIPMKNHQGDIIGVLQLINARDDNTDETREFTQSDQKLAESLASQAAISITNTRLIEQQRELFESFIQMIAGAIDEKSP